MNYVWLWFNLDDFQLPLTEISSLLVTGIDEEAMFFYMNQFQNYLPC